MQIYINEDKIREFRDLSDGNDELLISLIDKFLEHTPEHLEAAKKAFAEQNPKQVDFAIHTMKGSALSLGVEPLGSFLAELNKETKQGILSSFPQAFSVIEEALQELRKYRKEKFGS